MIRGRRLRLMTTPSRALPVLAAALLLAGAHPAAALDWGIGVEGGYNEMTNAKKSAKAIFDGKPGGGTIGGLIRVGVRQALFFADPRRHFPETGEPVMIA